jgi:CheY-like chemotaxis protein
MSSHIGRPPPKTPMVFDSLQARQLYLAEGLELCQQIKEGILIFSHSPTPLAHQKLMQWIQMLHQGALKLELTDIQLWGEGLAVLLESGHDLSRQSSMVHELLDHLCDGLQLSLISYSFGGNSTTTPNQHDSVLHSLIPKVLEIFEIVLTQPLTEQLQTQLLMQQVKWMQFWSQFLNLKDLNSIAIATLSAFERFPQSILAIAPVALAGFQVAYETTLRLPSDSLLSSDSLSIDPQRQPYPCEQALTVFNTTQHLVGLTQQTIFCIATASIEEIVLHETSQVLHDTGQEYIAWRDRQLPLHHFRDLWQSSCSPISPKTEPKNACTILILKYESQCFAVALEVERLIVESQLRLNPSISVSASIPKRCCYGIATLSDGLELEVVDVNCLLIEGLAIGPQASSQRFKTILVVDDSRTMREILSLTLEGAGYSVLKAENGQQAIEHLKNQATIHLIICDIEMSNFNGFEFLRHRLQDPYLLKIPVVILSSHADDEYRQLSQKLGAAEYFTIPYDPTALIQSIETLFRLIPNPLVTATD